MTKLYDAITITPEIGKEMVDLGVEFSTATKVDIVEQIVTEVEELSYPNKRRAIYNPCHMTFEMSVAKATNVEADIVSKNVDAVAKRFDKAELLHLLRAVRNTVKVIKSDVAAEKARKDELEAARREFDGKHDREIVQEVYNTLFSYTNEFREELFARAVWSCNFSAYKSGKVIEAFEQGRFWDLVGEYAKSSLLRILIAVRHAVKLQEQNDFVDILVSQYEDTYLTMNGILEDAEKYIAGKCKRTGWDEGFVMDAFKDAIKAKRGQNRKHREIDAAEQAEELKTKIDAINTQDVEEDESLILSDVNTSKDQEVQQREKFIQETREAAEKERNEKFYWEIEIKYTSPSLGRPVYETFKRDTKEEAMASLKQMIIDNHKLGVEHVEYDIREVTPFYN